MNSDIEQTMMNEIHHKESRLRVIEQEIQGLKKEQQKHQAYITAYAVYLGMDLPPVEVRAGG